MVMMGPDQQSTLDAVCGVIGATEATVVEKAIGYMYRLHQAEHRLNELQGVGAGRCGDQHGPYTPTCDRPHGHRGSHVGSYDGEAQAAVMVWS